MSNNYKRSHPSTVRNCPVAVVGGAGFLGSHLVNYLIEDRGCKVVVIDNLEVGRREFVHKDAMFIHHDITGHENVLRSIFMGMTDTDKECFVFNYSARPYVPDSFDQPLRTFEVNALGAMKVINAAHESGISAILQVSSAELYGMGGYKNNPEADGVWSAGDSIGEDDPALPHSTYGAAKLAVDSYVQVRWREAETPCIALRQFNCVGERETHPYVIPEIINQLWRYVASTRNGAGYDCAKTWQHYNRNQSPTVRLGNDSVRDFLYAGDAVRMAVELLERGQFGEVYNLGSEQAINIYNLADMIAKLMGFGSVYISEDESRKRKWEIWHLLSDNSKIYSTIDARPTHTLEQALRKTIDDFHANGSRWCWG